jgi:multiple sugar transport system permease protein
MATSTVPMQSGGSGFSKDAQEAFAGITFVLPSLIVVALFVFLPMGFAFVMSLTNWTGNTAPSQASFIGFNNYQELLLQDGPTRDNFSRALKNTAYYALGVVPIQTGLSLLLAVIVNQRFLKFKGFFRTAFYFPSITSAVVVGTIFLWLFNTNGIINQLLTGLGVRQNVRWLADLNGLIHNFLSLFGLTLRTAPEWMRTEVFGQRIWDWISGPSVAMSAIMALAIWTTSGTLMLIYLAALQDVPNQLYEAASVDGATRWQQFRLITLPMLRPTTFFVVTIGLIGTFQVFDQVYVISAGEPAGTTVTVAYLTYTSSRGAAAMSAATAFMLFVIIMIFTLIQRRLMGGGKAK